MKISHLSLCVCVVLVLGCRNEPRSEPASASAKPSAAIASASPSASAANKSLDADQTAMAEMLVTTDCVPCHDQLMLEQQRLTPKQWGAVVKKMQGWGSQIPPDNVDMVVAYLANRYAVDKAEYDVPRIPITDVAARFLSSPNGAFVGGDARRGEKIFKDVCLTCHGENAQGGAIGIALADRLILQRPADFANTIRKGRGRMPGLPAYEDADIAALLAYLREKKPN